jgi:hypothetical protein
VIDEFEARAFHLSEAGQYSRDYDQRMADAKSAKDAEAASAYIQGLGLGDSIPLPSEYDYGAMLADGVHPKPDGAGRLPLPPQYWKPGHLVVRGIDLSSGQRVHSNVSLEDMVLGEGRDDGHELMDADISPADLDELDLPARNSFEAWMQTRGMQVVAGPAQKTGDAASVRMQGKPSPTAGDAGTALWDSLAGALKGAVAQTLGLPGDIESLLRMLNDSGNGQTLPTTEDVSAALPAVTTDPARQPSADMGQTVGEFAPVSMGKAAVSAVKKAAKPIAGAVGAVESAGAEDMPK